MERVADRALAYVASPKLALHDFELIWSEIQSVFEECGSENTIGVNTSSTTNYRRNPNAEPISECQLSHILDEFHRTVTLARRRLPLVFDVVDLDGLTALSGLFARIGERREYECHDDYSDGQEFYSELVRPIESFRRSLLFLRDAISFDDLSSHAALAESIDLDVEAVEAQNYLDGPQALVDDVEDLLSRFLSIGVIKACTDEEYDLNDFDEYIQPYMDVANAKLVGLSAEFRKLKRVVDRCQWQQATAIREVDTLAFKELAELLLLPWTIEIGDELAVAYRSLVRSIEQFKYLLANNTRLPPKVDSNPPTVAEKKVPNNSDPQEAGPQPEPDLRWLDADRDVIRDTLRGQQLKLFNVLWVFNAASPGRWKYYTDLKSLRAEKIWRGQPDPDHVDDGTVFEALRKLQKAIPPESPYVLKIENESCRVQLQR